MIDLRRLRILRAVSHYGTVTAAAQALHFTPSAASQQIRQLGRELGVALLEPQGRGVRLTTAAQSLLEHADAIEARWERAETEMRGLDTAPAGTLRVAGFPVAMARLLAPMAAALGRRYPRLDVRLLEAEPGMSLDLLFQGEIELAVIEAASGTPPRTDPRFDQEPLLDDELDLVVSDDHPLAGCERVPLSVAATESWILPVSGTTCHDHALSACRAAGFTPDGVHRTMDWGASAVLVAHGLGVTLIPRLADFSPSLPVTRVRLDGTPVPARKLLTCTRQGGRRHPAVAAALEELDKLAPAVAA
ncbi:DNA-binding transcriptional LysR family regulator [Nocardiopsis sp. Huas11]|uniref:LysR family transcriptional regulator n=1 Tax=Nocardiopsis sp. Huas11 TaxID=2183912 RepID=UPI000EACB2AB|nr:LysR family transcriptional regulator [Nocardiopsis sp. Huas11]RKS08802.1 DNA-binding transcriptional LysR family regulator [Nocardiopsis sp. Huas11]